MVNKTLVLAPKETVLLKNGMRVTAGKVEVAVPVVRTVELLEDKSDA